MKYAGYLSLSFALICSLGCNNANKSATEIKIGAVLPLSGSLAKMGENEKNAMEMAVQQLASEGVKVNVIYADSKSNPTEGGKEATRLLNIENVDLMIAATSGLANAVKPMVEEKKRNLITFTIDETVALNAPRVTRLYEGANEEASAMLDYIKANGQGKKVGLLYVQAPSSENWAKVAIEPKLKEFGNQVSFIESFKIGESDFKTIALKIKDSQIDYLAISSYGFELPVLLKELDNLNIKDNLTIIGGWGFINGELDAKSMEGLLVAGPEYFFKGESSAGDFIVKYKQKYNEKPNYDAAMAYNALMLIGKKMNKQNIERPSDEIFQTSEGSSGIIGDFQVDKEGNMFVKTTIGIFEGGVIKVK